MYQYTSAIAIIVAIALKLIFPNESNPLIKLQTGIQATLKPAQWIPKIRDIHRYRMEMGTFKWTNENKIVRDIKQAMEKTELIPQKVIKTDNGYIINAYYYTPQTAWLDVVVLNIVVDKDKNIMKIDGTGESTGVFPLIIPFAPILNMLFCWFPFDDWGNNKRYLTNLTKHIPSKL